MFVCIAKTHEQIIKMRRFEMEEPKNFLEDDLKDKWKKPTF